MVPLCVCCWTERLFWVGFVKTIVCFSNVLCFSLLSVFFFMLFPLTRFNLCLQNVRLKCERTVMIPFICFRYVYQTCFDSEGYWTPKSQLHAQSDVWWCLCFWSGEFCNLKQRTVCLCFCSREFLLLGFELPTTGLLGLVWIVQ